MVKYPWGDRVHTIGAGSKPILVRKLSVEKLVRVIAKAEEMMFVNACRLSVKAVRKEDGVKYAVELIEGHLSIGDQEQYFKV